MSLHCFNSNLAWLNRVVISVSVFALFTVFFQAFAPRQSFAEENLDRWMEVPFSGSITISRTRDSDVNRGGMSIHVYERAGVTATITGTKRIVGKKGERARLFPEGTLKTHINMETVRQSDDGNLLITQKLNAHGTKTFAYDPKKRGAKIANLKVNPGRGLYRLKLQSGHVEGEIYTDIKAGGTKGPKIVKGSWEVGAYLEDGYLNAGERPYNPASNSINDSAPMTAFTSIQFTPTRDGSRAVMLPDDPLLKALQSSVVPVKYNVTWNLTLGESPGKAVLLPVDEYPRWIPELRDVAGSGDPDQQFEWEGNTVSVIARIIEPAGAKGIIEFKLEDVSREPGVCLNEPTSQADTGPDLEIPSKFNRGMEIGSDSLSAKTKSEVNEATIVIRAKDFGAHGRLTATVTLVTPKGEVDVRAMYEKLGTFHVPLPQDEDDNYIADQWQREEHLPACDGLEDEDYKPRGATDGDGLSLYEEYRGFMLYGKHERLNPRKKDLFIYDPDQLVENSFFEKAVDPMKVWYVRKEQIHAFDSNNSRVVNFNHDSHHRVDQHGIVVIYGIGSPGIFGSSPGSAVNDWGGGGSPGNVKPYISIYVQFIRDMVGYIAEADKEPYKHKSKIMANRNITTDEQWAAFKEEQIEKCINVTVVHELGHAIGISHHIKSMLKTLPKGAKWDDMAPSFGSMTCVMRYLFDESYNKKFKQKSPESEMGAIMINPKHPWPYKYCSGGDDDCMGQIRISDYRVGK